MPDERDLKAEIRRSGRFSWYVTVSDGFLQWGPDGLGWIVLGSRERAERKAQKYLRGLERHLARREKTWTVRLDGAE